MPAMLISKKEWNEVRKASEAGVDDQQLSEDYGIPKGTIRIRRMREEWLTPNRLKAEVEAQKARAEALKHGNRGALVDGDVTRVTKPAEESISAQLLRDGEAAGLHAMKILLGKLAQAAKNPEMIDELATVGEVVVAAKGARSIAGLDRPELNANISMNFGAFWEAPAESCREVEKPRVLDV